MCRPQIGADGWERPRDNIFTRYRLRRILRALGLNELYTWQRQYVFSELSEVPSKKGCGKTTARLVNLAMWYHGVIDKRDITCAGILGDPDYYAASRRSRNYYLAEIEWAHAQCVAHGIRVFKIVPEERKRWWRP
ncbi:MAG: hypothetical protein CVV04_11905 [Firmicutes bacterium HGW-Firmicutes-9]|jgi:hypothetical protein|nr:MAG: hypothetical protein CVV04_11905 [Firmicutes bacterium HGW-Firmicutes-9]